MRPSVGPLSFGSFFLKLFFISLNRSTLFHHWSYLKWKTVSIFMPTAPKPYSSLVPKIFSVWIKHHRTSTGILSMKIIFMSFRLEFLPLRTFSLHSRLFFSISEAKDRKLFSLILKNPLKFDFNIPHLKIAFSITHWKESYD